MVDTPEGKVKRRVSKILKAAEEVYYFMPVQSGYGSPTLDYLGSSRGRAFAIETKAPGKVPTLRQKVIMRDMEAARMKTFVIDGNPVDYEALRMWLFGASKQLRNAASDAQQDNPDE